MRVGMIHYKTGSTDGVSLEMRKWKEVIELSGHTVFFCSGIHENEQTEQVTVIPELNYHRTEASRLCDGMFKSLEGYGSEEAFIEDLEKQTKDLEIKLSKWIETNNLETIIPENVWSVALHPALALALHRVVQHYSLKVLCHHHDFYWERLGNLSLTCKTAMQLADTLYPPHDPAFKHVVINTKAQALLAQRKGIETTVVPNVFDFTDPKESQEGFARDAFNCDFRKAIGLRESDILVLQATRIIPRKGIEMAIDVIEQMNKLIPSYWGKPLYDGRQLDASSKIVLVLAGYAEDDTTGAYLGNLKTYAKQKQVTMLHIGEQIASERRMAPSKTYSLWDAYSHADIVSYPSIWEGWGNQLLEAIKAKLPVMLFEYPVYLSDIKPKGLEVLSLGSTVQGNNDLGLVQVEKALYQKTAQEAIEVLTNKEKYEMMVENNFSVGKEFFSLDALMRYVKPLIQKWG